jgi:hypothetical protein
VAPEEAADEKMLSALTKDLQKRYVLTNLGQAGGHTVLCALARSF